MKAKCRVSILVNRSSEEVFAVLTGKVEQYWPERMEGEPGRLGAEFLFCTGDDHYSRHCVTEFIPGAKLVWLVTESIRKTDNFSWTGTRMIFELHPEGAFTRVHFTYDGYVLENEQERLAGLCDLVIRQNLYELLKDDSISVTLPTSLAEKNVFEALLRVKSWWGFGDLNGPTKALHDTFTICHPGSHYSRQTITEFNSGRRLVFAITESRLDWLKNPGEWNDTFLVFDLFPESLRFTHLGLTPDKECFEKVNKGWHTIICDNFLKTLKQS